MILHVSKVFEQKIRCHVTTTSVAQPGAMEAWSVDLLHDRRFGKFVVALHDASLWPILIPVQEARTCEMFLGYFLRRVADIYSMHGLSFDPGNQTVVWAKRSNRSLIGSMNDAKYVITRHALGDLEETGVIDWSKIENRMRQLPYSVIGNAVPQDMLARLFGATG